MDDQLLGSAAHPISSLTEAPQSFVRGLLPTRAKESRNEYEFIKLESSSKKPNNGYAAISSYETSAEHRSGEPEDIANWRPIEHVGWRNALAVRSLKHLSTAGWRQGARVALLVVSVCLLINLSTGIWAAARFGTGNAIVEVFRGDCKRAESINTWVHLVINALSTAMLSGSNFCMQCVSAPSRKDVDRAHSRRKWLDIGVSSFRNLTSISRKNVLLWTLLAFSSTPLHLMFNSAAFTSITTNDYNIIYATNKFTQGGGYDEALAHLFSDPSFNYTASQWNAGQGVSGVSAGWRPFGFDIAPVQGDLASYERLDNSGCIQAYGNDLITDRRTLVLISSNISAHGVNNSLLFADNIEVPNISESYNPYSWICNSSALLGSFSCYQVLPQILADTTTWKPSNYSAEYCLSQRVKGECAFSINLIIILIVIFCNVGKFWGMWYVAFGQLAVPLITIGDAVQSYLDNPLDDYRMCNVVNHDAVVHRTRQRWGPRIWKPSEQRRFDAVTKVRWRTFLILFVGSIFLTGILLAVAILSLPTGTTSASSLWKLGFGQVHAQSLIRGWAVASMKSKEAAITASVLIANTPQIILSLLYFALNTLLTNMALADEWTAYAHEYKALRVSDPTGQQRKTYFLSLPFKISLPLMLVSGILHWLVSQSLFTAVVAENDELGHLKNKIAIATCGFSPVGMIFTMSTMALVIIVTFVLGMQPLKSGIPLVGSSSAAIALACKGSKQGISTRPIRWGLLSRESSATKTKQYGFSDEDINPSTWGHAYATGPEG